MFSGLCCNEYFSESPWLKITVHDSNNYPYLHKESRLILGSVKEGIFTFVLHRQVNGNISS